MGKDLFERPYGRFYYLAKFLAKRGHNIHLSLLNYKTRSSQETIYCNNIHWSFYNIRNCNLTGYYKFLNKKIEEVHPDWIVGISDTYFGILAEHLGKKHKIHSLIDAYDNYESYIPWLKPLHLLWRRALRRADLVTAAGPALANLMGKYRPGKTPLVIPMSADPQFTNNLDKLECRKELNLPLDNKLVGYCGGIHRNRGVEQLFKAFKLIEENNNNIKLVISGRLFPGIKLPENSIFLGHLDDAQVPYLVKSLDAIVSVNLDTSFGKYSHPVKLYEAMQSGIPVVATETPATRWILSDHKELLAPFENPEKLSEIIQFACQQKIIEYQNLSSWEEQAGILEKHLINYDPSKMY